MSSTTVVVAGATGKLGRAVAAAAASQGYQVRALGRDHTVLAQMPEATERNALDLLSASPEVIEQAVAGAGAIISCVGASISPELSRGRHGFLRVDTPANQRLIEAAERQGVKRFVYVAVAGHDRLGQLNYVRAHEAVVQRLRASRLEAAVLRATGFFSAFESMLALARRGRVPLLGLPSARTNPILDDDLARLCVAALSEAPRERTVGGPEVLTRQRIAEMAFEAVGAPAKFVALPSWFVRTLGVLLWPLSPRVSELTRFFLEVSSIDCVGELCGSSRLGEFFQERS